MFIFLLRKYTLKRLILFISSSNAQRSTTLSNEEATILFSYLSNEKVDLIRLKTGKALETELIAMDDPAINSFLRVTNDSLCLEALKAFLCTKK